MTQRIAIIGGGVMGETLLSSILRSGYSPEQLFVSESQPDRATELSQKYAVSVADNDEAVRSADVVILAVKPHTIAAVVDQIAGQLADGAVVVSIAAGIRIAQVEGGLARGAAVVRVMPNTAATVNEGMFVMSPGSSCTEEQLERVRDLMSTAGAVETIAEEDQDAVVGVSGSGPAYVFYLAEAMIAGGMQAGLSEDVARRLTVQTILGSAQLLTSSAADPAELRRQVTSQGGTTAAATAVFDERELSGTVIDGVQAAVARSIELATS